MTQYFLTLPHDTTDEPTMESMAQLDPAELQAMMAAVDAFNTALTDATGEQVTRLPQPFVEATEYVGGFWIIEAADQEAALTWAEQCSAAVQSRIEVRALQEAPPE